MPFGYPKYSLSIQPNAQYDYKKSLYIVNDGLWSIVNCVVFVKDVLSKATPLFSWCCVGSL